MNASSVRARAMALVQMLLLLPALVGGSICVSLDGSQASELGPCACTLSSVSETHTLFGATGKADCGPCRDEWFSALRHAPPTSACSLVPAGMASMLGSPAEPASSAPIGARWTGDPLGRRLPILRC